MSQWNPVFCLSQSTSRTRDDQLQRRYFLISLIVGLSFLVAVIGYAIPPEKEKVPARVVLDNTGGRVLFSHRTHAEEYHTDCADCHHYGLEGGTSLPCGACHPPEFNDEFRLNHQKAFPDKAACLRCHDEAPTGPLAEGERPDIESIPTRGDAFHTMCQGCHEQGGGPFGADACYQCHER